MTQRERSAHITCWNNPWWNENEFVEPLCRPSRQATSNWYGEICISSIKLPNIKSTYRHHKPIFTYIQCIFTESNQFENTHQVFVLLVSAHIVRIIDVRNFVGIENYNNEFKLFNISYIPIFMSEKKLTQRLLLDKRLQRSIPNGAMQEAH